MFELNAEIKTRINQTAEFSHIIFKFNYVRLGIIGRLKNALKWKSSLNILSTPFKERLPSNLGELLIDHDVALRG